MDRATAALAATVTRFWENVDRRGPDECWPWLGYIEDGYGRVFFDGKMRGAHDLAATFATGAVRPEGFDTCHSCDNSPCCNPAHLRFDSRQGNVDDATSRGRHARGQTNGHAKLTERDVLEIRELFAAGTTGSSLARRFNVAPSAITAVVRGKRWRHVGGPITTLPAGRPRGPRKGQPRYAR